MSDEKRQDRRRQLTGAIFIEVVAASDSMTQQNKIVICRTFDISTGGLRVCVDENIEIGSILQLGADLNPGTDPIYLVGEVRWNSPNEEGPGYWVGFELLESADTDIDAWHQLLKERG